MSKILIVDDEQEITELLQIYLNSEGFETLIKNDANAIMDDVKDVDLVILDIMLPGIDGLQACQMIRDQYPIPILMLSAKSLDTDKITGLNLGADDYITKPFNPLEVVARVKSHLRRQTFYEQKPSSNTLQIRQLKINTQSHTVTKNGQEIVLTPTEFEILALLCSQPGNVFSMEKIFELVWKEKYFDSNNTVMVHIRKLRSKIEDDPASPTYIKTVWGVGYKVDA